MISEPPVRPYGSQEPHRASRGGRDPGAAVGGLVPQRFDVVSCYFPHHEAPNRPGVKARPCLVLGTRRSPATGQVLLRVAYGTTAPPNPGACGEIHVHRPECRKAAGLDRQTKFVLTRIAVVPFRFEWFRADRSGSTVLGRLHEHDRAAAGRMLAASRRRGERD